MKGTSNRSILYAITDRRPDEATISVADPNQATEHLGWRTLRGIEGMCLDG